MIRRRKQNYSLTKRPSIKDNLTFAAMIRREKFPVGGAYIKPTETNSSELRDSQSSIMKQKKAVNPYKGV